MPYNHYPVSLDEDEEPELFEIVLHSAEVGPPSGDFNPLRVLTSRGTVEGRLYRISRPRCGVLVLNGSDGGWCSPAHGLYPRLGRELRRQLIATLRLRYRQPDCLEECVLDALAGIGYLESEGLHSIALIGHDLGGAVALQAAAISASVRTVLTLATTPDGPDPAELPANCPLLLIHGLSDLVSPVDASEELYELARPRRKQLVLYPDAGHQLDEVAVEVHDMVSDWLGQHLRGGAPT